ncbi:MAG: PD40 domain-containing protein, partial [Acidobacteriaceae bacterium]|nr:PD40 domain-containing protein [Acidobacteriaceae bacterium]
MTASSSPDAREITDPMSVVSSPNAAAQPVSISSLYYTRSVSGPAWSPDGRQIVFSTNLTGRMNIWKVAATGGWPLQLSESDDRQFGAVWSPDGKWIVFEQDNGGGEIFDVYAVPSDGGDTINITGTPDISETNPRWSPDGSMLALSYRPKSASSIDIALLDWKSRQVHKLTNEQTKNREWGAAIWSPDGKTIYADRANAGHTDSDVYRINVADGQSENLTPHHGDIIYSVSSVSPQGDELLISSNEKGGYQNVALLNTASRKITWVTDLKWEAEAGNFSPDSNRF